LLEHPDYYHYRAEVLAFLEEYEHGHKKSDPSKKDVA
jgi:nitrate/nitrite transport system ATP-binding protein